MTTAAGSVFSVDAGGILGNGIAVAVAAAGRTGWRLDSGMTAGNGVMTGCAAKFCMGGVAKLFRIDIILAADFFLTTVARNTGDIFAVAAAERIVTALRFPADPGTGNR
jgi:hypothetical protein